VRRNIEEKKKPLFEMASYPGFSGVPTPPPSEDGGCPSGENAPPTLIIPEVNKPDCFNPTSLSPPATPPQPRRLRDRLSLQKEREANRSKQFTNRLQRAASDSAGSEVLGRDGSIRRKRDYRQKQRHSAPGDCAKGEEKANEQVLTKMAFAEQQKWITVQQKTFTKWWVGIGCKETPFTDAE
jgi:type IV secretory pathway VirB10-like protein